MFSRFRVALGSALLVALITSITVFAKGNFSFITITGSNLKDVVRLTDPALTTDFFAFADFYQDKTGTPEDPGEGYEITRYYIDAGQESTFDQLHYYPKTGYVFYDGIVNGDSEYDGKWYKANPDILKPFETALSIQIRPLSSASQPQAVKSIEQTRSSAPVSQAPPITAIIVIIAGLAVALIFAYWRHKPAVQ